MGYQDQFGFHLGMEPGLRGSGSPWASPLNPGAKPEVQGFLQLAPELTGQPSGGAPKPSPGGFDRFGW